jgi:hypothetical protein
VLGDLRRCDEVPERVPGVVAEYLRADIVESVALQLLFGQPGPPNSIFASAMSA